MARTAEDALKTNGVPGPSSLSKNERNHSFHIPQQANMVDCGVLLLYRVCYLGCRINPWQETVIPRARKLLQ